MATKANKVPAAKKPVTKKVMVATFPDPPDKDMADSLAKIALLPSVNAAMVLVEYTKALGEQDIGALARLLSDGIDDLWAGDTKRAEAMLYAQAHTLQAIFTNLARRAASQEYLKQWEAYLRMAMKAQNQCRMTLETLATIKNPPTVFARQANINNGGQQQVNNGITSGHPARARTRDGEIASAQNKLLEADHGQPGQRMDTRAAQAAERNDPAVAAVEQVHRAAKPRG